MSEKAKERFWAEFKVFSSVRGEMLSVKMRDEELDINDGNERQPLKHITTRKVLSELFEKKLPVYLSDVIAQLYQEIKLESNPHRRKLFLSKKFTELISRVFSEYGLSIHDKYKKRGNKPNSFALVEEQDFIKQLKKKAFFELDKAIIFNIDKLDLLVYMYEGQTILKNPIFFDLFQHWFTTPVQAERIDDLIYQLKKKAGLMKPGPKGFSAEQQLKIIFRYEYLRRILSKIKKIVKEPFNEAEAEKEWIKLEDFLGRYNYFQIDKCKTVTVEKWKKYTPSKYIPHNWLKNHIRYFMEIFKHDMTDGEAKEEIRQYIEGKVEQGQARDIKKYGIESFLKFQSLTALKNTEPSDLAFYVLSKIMQTTKRKIRWVIDSNRKKAQHALKVLSQMPEFN